MRTKFIKNNKIVLLLAFIMLISFSEIKAQTVTETQCSDCGYGSTDYDNGVLSSTKYLKIGSWSTPVKYLVTTSSFTTAAGGPPFFETATLTITAPAGFKICETEAGTYTDNLVYTAAAVNFTDKEIWIKADGSTSGNIQGGVVYSHNADGTITSSGARNPAVFYTAVTSPEMNVKGNSTSIVNNDAMPSSTDYTIFEETGIGSSNNRIYTIENSDNGNLTFSTPASSNGRFVVSEVGSSPIAKDGSSTFKVTFTPNAVGTVTSTIEISNNDSDENPYAFVVSGTGVEAVPSIPSIADATSIEATSFAANWNAVSGVTDYNLDVSIGTSGTFDANIVSGYDDLLVVGTSKIVSGLTAGTTYYYRVRAENSAGESANSTEESLITAAAAPTTQAHTITFSAITTTSETIIWQRGSGSNCIVVINEGTISTPGDGFVPTVNTAWAGSGGQQVVYDGNSTTVNITNLTAGTDYTVQVFEYNGTSTGRKYNVNPATNNPKSGATTYAAATINTTTISNVAATTATSGGSGLTGDNITAKGICWNTAENPTTANSKTSDGSGDASFSSTMSGLTAGTSYNVRAYATNPSGTVYGENVSFTTEQETPSTQAHTVTFSNIEETTLTVSWSSGNGSGAIVIMNEGSISAPANGTDPTADASWNNSTQQVIYEGDANTVNITGLVAGTTYTFQVFEYNGNSSARMYNANTAASNPNTKKTTYAAATINTTTISNVAATTATSGGSGLTGDNITAKGICWNTAENPTTANSKTSDGSGDASFSSTMSGLTAGTSYNVRAYATNPSGTVYGENVNFTTEQETPTTQANTIIFTGTVQTTSTVSWTRGDGDGCIVMMNEGDITNPSNGTDPTSDASWNNSTQQVVYEGTGTTVNITGLTAGTTYTFQVFEYNGDGTARKYNTDNTATDNPNTEETTFANASVTTTTITNIASTTASSGGNTITGENITAKGVCWSTTENPTTSDSKTSDGSTNASFASSITGLTAGTTYYVKAYVTNPAGTFYGSQKDFTTAFEAPTTQASAITFGTISGSDINITSWNNGSGTNSVLYINSTNSFTAPTNGTEATANTNYVGSGQQAISVGTGTSATVTGLTSGTTYYFTVYSYNGTTSSTVYNQNIASNQNNVQTTAGAPTATDATLQTTSGFTANWETVDGAASYKLDVATDNGFSSFVSGYQNKSVSSNAEAVTGLSSATDYYYRVRAVNSEAQEGSSSNMITTSTLCDAPTATTASDISGTQFNANWNTQTGAISYILQVSTLSNFSSTVYDANVGSVLTKVVDGLTGNTTYYYRVKAVNDGGESAVSNTMPVTTAGVITAKVGTYEWVAGSFVGDVLPGSANNVEIPTGANITISSVTSAETADLTIYGNLTIQSGGDIISDGTLTLKDAGNFKDMSDENYMYNNATIERSLTGGYYHFVSFPVAGLTVNDILPHSTETFFKWYDENANAGAGTHWNNINSPSYNLNTNYAYGVKYANTETMNFSTTSNFREGNITQTISNSATGWGWNLVGNPYPCAVDIASLTLNGVKNTTVYYMKSNGVIATYNANTDEGTNGATQYIPKMQGFLVQCRVDGGASQEISATYTGSIEFTNASKVINSASFFKKLDSENNTLRLIVSGNDYSQEAIINFQEQASDDYDVYDSDIFFTENEEVPHIYTVIGENELVINTYSNPMTENLAVNVGFKVGIEGDYTISTNVFEAFNSNQELFLEDKVTNEFINLQNDLIYTFHSEATDGADRFVLHFANPNVSIDDIVNENKLNIYSYENKLYIKGLISNNTKVVIYDMYGKEITTNIFEESKFETISLDNFASGNYLVKVTTDEKVYTEKVFVKK